MEYSIVIQETFQPFIGGKKTTRVEANIFLQCTPGIFVIADYLLQYSNDFNIKYTQSLKSKSNLKPK